MFKHVFVRRVAHTTKKIKKKLESSNVVQARRKSNIEKKNKLTKTIERKNEKWRPNSGLRAQEDLLCELPRVATSNWQEAAHKVVSCQPKLSEHFFLKNVVVPRAGYLESTKHELCRREGEGMSIFQ